MSWNTAIDVAGLRGGPVSSFISTSRGILFPGDCVKVLGCLESSTLDMVFADPPFNLGKDYGNGSQDSLPDRDYIQWCEKWLHQSVRCLKPGGSLFIYNLPRWNMEIAHYLTHVEGMSFRHWIAISMKNGYPRQKHLYPAHYALLYFTKGTPGVFNADAVRYPMPVCRHCGKPLADWGGYKTSVNPAGINLSDIWTDLSPIRHRKSKARPRGINELDPRIAERAILLTTRVGGLVMDPFGGGGGTYVVAERNNRHWIGCEIGDCGSIAERLRVTESVEISSPKLPDNIIAALGELRDVVVKETGE